MLAALVLEEKIKKFLSGELVAQDLTDLFKHTWKEAFKEGQKDAREVCGCLGEEEV